MNRFEEQHLLFDFLQKGEWNYPCYKITNSLLEDKCGNWWPPWYPNFLWCNGIRNVRNGNTTISVSSECGIKVITKAKMRVHYHIVPAVLLLPQPHDCLLHEYRYAPSTPEEHRICFCDENPSWSTDSVNTQEWHVYELVVKDGLQESYVDGTKYYSASNKNIKAIGIAVDGFAGDTYDYVRIVNADTNSPVPVYKTKNGVGREVGVMSVGGVM